MSDEQVLRTWWDGLTADQRARAAALAARPAPRGMAVDDLSASLIVAGLPTSRPVWTGQPEHLVELLDEVAEFVVRMTPGQH
ncbi:hypothetical protein [Propionicimonas sp.]|uniref:hypothetical protein n=1 Tax=Propionicimonas sp. TaxID=1955623 RepID=UPI0039E33444